MHRLTAVFLTILFAAAILSAEQTGLPEKEEKVSSADINALSSSLIGEDISWQVISSGGENNGTSASYGLAGTVGQTAGGSGNSTSYGLNHGFWQDFGGGEPTVCVPGDADESGFDDIDDVVYLINYIFAGGPAPSPSLCCGDADGSGGVDIDDVVYLINYIFAGGPAPVDIC